MREAIERGETVAVYGDYDVDGITSACLVTSYLRSRGLKCLPYIPDRLEEGYGLNSAALDIVRAGGATLMITVDCGITAVEEARYARELGLDLIITDHHECGSASLPEALSVVDPKRPDCRYANKGLAGVGVAFKLLCAVDGDAEGLLTRYADLVAAGTVADVMPLTGENRYIGPPRPGAACQAAAPRCRSAAARVRRIRQAHERRYRRLYHCSEDKRRRPAGATPPLAARLLLSQSLEEATPLAPGTVQAQPREAGA